MDTQDGPGPGVKTRPRRKNYTAVSIRSKAVYHGRWAGATKGEETATILKSPVKTHVGITRKPSLKPKPGQGVGLKYRKQNEIGNAVMKLEQNILKSTANMPSKPIISPKKWKPLNVPESSQGSVCDENGVENKRTEKRNSVASIAKKFQEDAMNTGRNMSSSKFDPCFADKKGFMDNKLVSPRPRITSSSSESSTSSKPAVPAKPTILKKPSISSAVSDTSDSSGYSSSVTDTHTSHVANLKNKFNVPDKSTSNIPPKVYKKPAGFGLQNKIHVKTESNTLPEAFPNTKPQPKTRTNYQSLPQEYMAAGVKLNLESIKHFEEITGHIDSDSLNRKEHHSDNKADIKKPLAKPRMSQRKESTENWVLPNLKQNDLSHGTSKTKTSELVNKLSKQLEGGMKPPSKHIPGFKKATDSNNTSNNATSNRNNTSYHVTSKTDDVITGTDDIMEADDDIYDDVDTSPSVFDENENSKSSYTSKPFGNTPVDVICSRSSSVSSVDTPIPLDRPRGCNSHHRDAHYQVWTLPQEGEQPTVCEEETGNYHPDYVLESQGSHGDSDDGWTDEESASSGPNTHSSPVTLKHGAAYHQHRLRMSKRPRMLLPKEVLHLRTRATINRHSTKARESRKKGPHENPHLTDTARASANGSISTEVYSDRSFASGSTEEDWETESDDGYEEVNEPTNGKTAYGSHDNPTTNGITPSGSHLEVRDTKDAQNLSTSPKSKKLLTRVTQGIKNKISKTSEAFNITPKTKKKFELVHSVSAVERREETESHESLRHSKSASQMDVLGIEKSPKNKRKVDRLRKSPTSPRNVNKPLLGIGRQDSDASASSGTSPKLRRGDGESSSPPPLPLPRKPTKQSSAADLNAVVPAPRAKSLHLDSYLHKPEMKIARSLEDLTEPIKSPTGLSDRPPPPLPRNVSSALQGGLAAPPKPPRAMVDNRNFGGGQKQNDGFGRRRKQRAEEPRENYEIVEPVLPTEQSNVFSWDHEKGAWYFKSQEGKKGDDGYIPPDGVKGKDGYLPMDGVAQDNTEPCDASAGPPPTEPRSSNVSSLSGSYIDGEEIATIPTPLLAGDRSRSSTNTSSDGENYLQLEGENLTFTRHSSRFNDEPLYQVYTQEVIKRTTIKRQTLERLKDQFQSHGASDEDNDDWSSDEDVYDDTEIGVSDGAGGLQYESAVEFKKSSVYSSGASSAGDIFSKTNTGSRTLWCEMPEVKDSGILAKLSAQDKKLQEAMFEVVTSEASYLKSLDLLINNFLMAPEFSDEHSTHCVLKRIDRHFIFSNVVAVRNVSEKFIVDVESRMQTLMEVFMTDLENMWQKSIILTDICDIISHHASEHFQVYVTYCSNQVYQDRTIKRLIQDNPEFVQALQKLESFPECQGLNMQSFLLLPMQRITRLPLLIDAIHHRMERGSNEHKAAVRAHAILSKVVKECNEGARKMERTEQMCAIDKKLNFKVKKIPLISSARYLVKQGELLRVTSDATARLKLGKPKAIKQPMYFFLFNDLLLVGKKKGEDMYSITDHTSRSAVHTEVIDDPSKDPRLPYGVPTGLKNLFVLVLLENHEQKNVEFVLACESESDRTRWIDALTPKYGENEDEVIYEDWDCPQVQAVHTYMAQQPDELTLDECDVVSVLKKTSDGWFEGERLRDGERGWFPSSCTVEIQSAHMRAKNLKQRYRLLVASQAYLKDEFKKGAKK